MKILVTGAAGYIGANLCEYFLEKGHSVIGIDNFNDYYPRVIKEFNIAKSKEYKNFSLVEADITDRDALFKLFKDEEFDAVLHMAAWAGVTPSIDNPEVYARVNYVGTSNLGEFSTKTGVKKFIFASTSSIYENNNKIPFTEDMDSSTPAAPYPASKKGGEVLLYTYSLNHDLAVVVFRIFNPVGIYMRPDLAIPKLIRSALYGLEFPLYMDPNVSKRDYTYMGDMLPVFEKALTNSKGYGIYNLGNADPKSLTDLKNTVEELLGKKIKTREDYKPGQMNATYSDTSKAREVFDYKPGTTLLEMIKKYYDWFIKQPEWYKKGDY
jgi:UDP-glucuronate 4-epimerase